ncbi:MAG: hypothetical protein ACM3UL_00215 [Ignavibacteria bacterium]
MQKAVVSQEKENTNLVAPIEEQFVRTTLNIQKSLMEGISRIGASKNLTLTVMTNEALKDYCAKMNNVQQIENMIRETNGFWFERDLSQVTKLLPIEVAKAMLPYQIAYLYCNLKDTADRERIFAALKLSDQLQQINAYNGLLQKVSQFDGEKLKGYNVYQLALDIRAKLTPLQCEYLTLKIGSDSMETLRQRRPDIFPEVTLQSQLNEETEAAEQSAAEESEELGDLLE